MAKTELKTMRMNMLGAMHSIMMEKVDDENFQAWWLTDCVPDCPSEDDLASIAEDEKLWAHCCYIFSLIMMYYEVRP